MARNLALRFRLYSWHQNNKTPMRTIKLFTAALLLGIACTASAQSDKDAAKSCANMAKARAELMTKELALNEEQSAKVHDMLLKNEENLVGMRGHCEMMDAKAKKADEATYASITEMLDEKQQVRMKELIASGKLESCVKEEGKGCCSGKKADKATKVKSGDNATKKQELRAKTVE